jgi:hypothetical protein
VEHLAVPGRRGRVGEDGGGDGGHHLVDQQRLGTVDQEEAGKSPAGEVAEERLGLQGLDPGAGPRTEQPPKATGRAAAPLAPWPRVPARRVEQR